jgi:hypothetical protein
MTERTRKRSHHQSLKSLKRSIVVILLAFLLVAGLLAVRQRGRFRTEPGSNAKSFSKSKNLKDLTALPALLSIKEIKFDDKTRTLKGILANPTGKGYKAVEMSFQVLAPDNTEIGVIEATVPGVEPNQDAHFETSPMPKGAVAYSVREIIGTPR